MVILLERDKVMTSRIAAKVAALGRELHATSSMQGFVALAVDEQVRPRTEVALVDHRLLGAKPLAALAECIRIYAGVPLVLMIPGVSMALATRAGGIGVRSVVPRTLVLVELESLLRREPESLEPETATLERIRAEHIQLVLEEHDYNISRAARALGVDRRTLQRRPEHIRRR